MTRTKARRRLLTPILLVFAACLTGTVACGESDEGPIVFAGLADLTTSKQIEAAVADWNKDESHRGQHVTYVELPESADEQRSQLVATAQAKDSGDECYDVHALDVVWTAEFAHADYAVPLDEDEQHTKNIEENLFLRSAWESGQDADRRQWAVPFLTNAPLLYYRRDILNDYRKTVLGEDNEDPPADLADVVELARSIPKSRATAGMGAIGGYAGQFSRYEGLTVNAMEVVWEEGGDINPRNIDKPVVNPTAVEKALKLLADGAAPGGWIHRDSLNYTERGTHEAFANGDVMFMRNWPYAYNLLPPRSDDERKATKENVGVVALPWSRSLGGQNLVVSPCSEHRRTAWSFIEYLATDLHVQQQLFDAGYPAAREEIYSDLPDSEFNKAVRKSLDGARVRPSSPYYGGAVSKKIQKIFSDALPYSGAPVNSPMRARELLETELPDTLKGR